MSPYLQVEETVEVCCPMRKVYIKIKGEWMQHKRKQLKIEKSNTWGAWKKIINILFCDRHK